MRPVSVVVIVILIAATVSTTLIQRAGATTQTITAFKATNPVKIDGVIEPGEWSDAQILNESTSGMGVAFKHNSTGMFMLFQWKQSPSLCFDQYCYGGIELDNLNNSGPMGSSPSPSIMLLLSTSFTGGYDEFVSKAEVTPTPVETDGYKTQSTCVLQLSGNLYTGECYRPFTLSNAASFDAFLGLAAGSSIEIAFAVGEFSEPGLHGATDMSTYTLTLSDQTYTSPTGTSETTQSSGTSLLSSNTSASSTPGQSILAGFPGLNLITLYICAGVALLIGIILGVGVALRSKKLTTGK